jgi:hypothetical protein
VSAEFTYYALFLMLAVTTGVVFQFCLGRLKKIQKDIAKMNASIAKLHYELRDNGKIVNQIKSQHKGNVIPFRRKNKRLAGNLELEYQGSKASTRAIFHIDDES